MDGNLWVAESLHTCSGGRYCSKDALGTRQWWFCGCPPQRANVFVGCGTDASKQASKVLAGCFRGRDQTWLLTLCRQKLGLDSCVGLRWTSAAVLLFVPRFASAAAACVTICGESVAVLALLCSEIHSQACFGSCHTVVERHQFACINASWYRCRNWGRNMGMIVLASVARRRDGTYLVCLRFGELVVHEGLDRRRASSCCGRYLDGQGAVLTGGGRCSAVHDWSAWRSPRFLSSCLGLI